MSVLTRLLFPLAAVPAPWAGNEGFSRPEASIFVEEISVIRVIPRLEVGSAETRITGPLAQMPVIQPDPEVDFKLLVTAPDPGVDYKLRVIE